MSIKVQLMAWEHQRAEWIVELKKELLLCQTDKSKFKSE